MVKQTSNKELSSDRSLETTKLYATLQAFDKYEQNKFRKFLQSPYYNKDETILQLFEELVSHINGSSGHQLTKEKIWKKIRPKSAFDDVRFRKYNSDLLKLAETFLALQSYEAEPIHQGIFLMKHLQKKKISKLLSSSVNDANRILENYPFETAEYFFHRYMVELEYYNLTGSDLKRDEKTNIEQIVSNLDNFYFSEKLKLYALVLSRKNIMDQDYDFLLIDDLIKTIKEKKYNKTASIWVYYYISLMLDSPKNEYYFELKTYLEIHYKKFPPKEIYDIYTHLMNFCIKKFREDRIFLTELFDLYKYLIDKKVLIIDNVLSPWDFKNIVAVGIGVKEYSWVETFVHSYHEYLPESERKNALTYNLAFVYFYQRKYDQVLKLLQTVEYNDIFYNLDSKALLVVNYYEMEEIEVMMSLLESFRTYLNRNKNIVQVLRYGNFIKYTKRLAKIIPGDKKSIEKLNTEISSNPNTVYLSWLREKIAELAG